MITLRICLICVACSAPSQQLAERARATTVFSEVPQAAKETLKFVAPLGDFDATDINGRRWGLRELRGKITFVDIWSTDCGPCLREHPRIQGFYEKWKASSSVQVLTFSIDDDPRRVEAYMKKNRYTFPVIVTNNFPKRCSPG